MQHMALSPGNPALLSLSKFLTILAPNVTEEAKLTSYISNLDMSKAFDKGNDRFRSYLKTDVRRHVTVLTSECYIKLAKNNLVSAPRLHFGTHAVFTLVHKYSTGLRTGRSSFKQTCTFSRRYKDFQINRIL